MGAVGHAVRHELERRERPQQLVEGAQARRLGQHHYLLVGQIRLAHQTTSVLQRIAHVGVEVDARHAAFPALTTLNVIVQRGR
jgi:hypothetical protein